jgi:SPP1 family predicted phage head-tail adaptor
MDARRLNVRVLIKQLVDAQDDIGQPTQVWANLISDSDGKVAANIKHLSGIETIKGGAETGVVKASIRIRRRTNVTPAMRVHYSTTVYEIKAVLPDVERKDYMDLSCEVIQ